MNAIYVFNPTTNEDTFMDEEYVFENIDTIGYDNADFSDASEEAIRRFADKLDWTKMQKLSAEGKSIDFIREFADKIDWKTATDYIINEIGEDSIEEFLNYVNWTVVSEYASEEFLRKHIDRIDWKSINERWELSNEFYNDFKEIIKWYDECTYEVLSIEEFREFADKINWDIASSALIYNEIFTKNFIREFADKIVWWKLDYKKFIDDDEFFDEFADKIDWAILSPIISEKLIRKFSTKSHDWVELYQRSLSGAFSDNFKNDFATELDEGRYEYELL